MKKEINHKIIQDTYEEISHLISNVSFEEFKSNYEIINSHTNINIRYKKFFIRIPRNEQKIFFNRKNEYFNMNQAHKILDFVPLPLYFNQETGLMVNNTLSSEIFLTEKELQTEYITQAIHNLNELNGSGLSGMNAFNYEIAFAYFRTTNMFGDKELNWVENFYKRFFITDNDDRLEFSHNDPAIENFTMTNLIIDYEYSGMSPVMSDICNFDAMYLDKQPVKRYFINTNAPTRDMQPLIIFWSLFWGMWGLSKENDTAYNKNYTMRAAKRYEKGVKLLAMYMENNDKFSK